METRSERMGYLNSVLAWGLQLSGKMSGRLSLGLILTLVIIPAATAEEPLADTQADRIVAFGDVHGGATELRALLQAMQMIDGDENWIGGQTRLVSLGDLLDRGPDSRAVMDLLIKLEAQAEAHGGALLMVLGNHEIMNLLGDLRYVSTEEYAAFAAEEDPQIREAARSTNPGAEFPPGYFAHRAAFASDGLYGRWLLSKPQILELDGIAFVHGGLSETFAGIGIEEFNLTSGAELSAALALGERLIAAGTLPPWQDLLTATPINPEPVVTAELETLRNALQFQPDGPTWYRGTAGCHPLLEQPRFEAVLNARGLKRIVMGHTPTNPRIPQGRFDNRALLADTGMYRAYYRGRPSALVFSNNEVRAFTLTDDGIQTLQLGRTPIDVRTGSETALQEDVHVALTGISIRSGTAEEIIAAGRPMKVTWRREGRTEQAARLAAYALDKLLGFGLVAPILEHEIDGKSGTVEILPGNAISESERVSEGRFRPNYCSADSGSDYNLMLLLDGLMGQPVRNGSNVWYDPATWLMYLLDQNKAFPGSGRLPVYLTDRLAGQRTGIPRLPAERLAKLTMGTLEESLGDYLSDRQLKAILARRDLLLKRWAPGI